MQSNLTVGMLAHVDAGKTTLSEGMLFRGGCLRQLGRVDHQDAFLDTGDMERKRGITIFSKQAVLPLEGVTLTLLDTPGHVDFSAEMERTLPVLDYAVLVINGSDGVQGHTLTLWQLLERYHIPTFLFINKMDLPGTDRDSLLAQLQKRLHSHCVSFFPQPEPHSLEEEIALCDDAALDQFLDHGRVGVDTVARLIRRRQLFPCFFGAALKLEGVDRLLDGLTRYTCSPSYSGEFGAKVFKITRDQQNNRLTHLKITGGSLRVKDLLSNHHPDLPQERVWAEKVNQIRIYSGERYTVTEEAAAGTVCAVTGLSQTYPGQGLGAEGASLTPVLEPGLSFRVLLPEESDPMSCLLRLRQLEEEDPQLSLSWMESSREIHLHLMGEVQLEVLRHLILERFGLEVDFDAGRIVYRETIARPVIGIGHFEPLRHYAEVHLLLEPGPRGSGLCVDCVCGEDDLSRPWQRQVLSYLQEEEHPGVLTGSPLTDLKITLLTGKAHNKHTQGGDFHKAAGRALRQGLMQAQSILLEPWYQFRLEVPGEAVGRAMTDLQRMTDDLSLPESSGGCTILTGSAPMACLREYTAQVTAYTGGLGRLTCSSRGFAPCRGQEEIVEAIGYDPERDVEHPADSIFCSHGTGVVVKWNEVKEHMHLDSGICLAPQEPPSPFPAAGKDAPKPRGSLEQDAELQAIYEHTYGPIKHRDILPKPVQSRPQTQASPAAVWQEGPDYLLVDGYNIIHAWEDLREIARLNMDAARQCLMDLLSNYQSFRQKEIILVFDAYQVPGGVGEVSRYHNISVVYTKEAETADAYIEKVTYQMGKQHRVTVATSDSVIQMIIWGHGALRLTPQALREEMEQTNADIRDIIQKNNRKGSGPSFILGGYGRTLAERQ